MKVPGVCAWPSDRLEPVDQGCRILGLPPHWVHERERRHRCITRYGQMDIPGWRPWNVHTDCICNEYVGLRNRVIGVVPKPSSQAVLECRSIARKIARRMHRTGQMDLDRVPAVYTGRKRAKYENAVASLKVQLAQRRDAALNTFVKCERTDFRARSNPDPRVIQFRNARYTAELISYLRPMEHQLYNTHGDESFTLLPPSRCIAKGLNLFTRAELFVNVKLARFAHPVTFSLDCSRWDKHVSREMLHNVEHMFYTELCSDTRLKELLAYQLRSFGYTNSGIKYVVDGRRCSGDANTALGNCLLALVFCARAMQRSGVVKWDCLVDGDDTVVIIEEEDFGKLDRLSDYYLECGQVLKIENVNRSGQPEGILFCQSKPIFADGRWKFVRNPHAVMAKCTTGIRYYNEAGSVQRVYYTVGQCELAMQQGVPVLQAFALGMMRNGDSKGHPGMESRQLEQVLKMFDGDLSRIKPRPVTPEARQSFHRAYGIDPCEQRRLEAILDAWVVDWSAPRLTAPEWVNDGAGRLLPEPVEAWCLE